MAAGFFSAVAASAFFAARLVAVGATVVDDTAALATVGGPYAAGEGAKPCAGGAFLCGTGAEEAATAFAGDLFCEDEDDEEDLLGDLF